MNYEVYKDQGGDFRWRLKAANGKIVADSGQGYNNKADCLAGIELCKGSANSPIQDGT